MDCQFAFLCDFAEQDRKLHAVGIGWDILYAPNLPAVHPIVCLVAKLTGSIAESGTKDITLRLIDADGADVIPELRQQVPFEVKPPRLTGAMQLVLQLTGLPLQKYGTYAFHLVVQGNEMVTVPFSVVAPPTTA